MLSVLPRPNKPHSSAVDSSSHNHLLSSLRCVPSLPSWLHGSYAAHNHRYERIALGRPSIGMAVLTRELMEMHIQQAPDIRGMLDCLPVADRPNMTFIGWRQKLGTWPLSKQERLVSRQFAA